ncbi:MAG TPA: universal stress protein, partial [Cyanothece sp. UBA12306]|nr:universal stress protein [Cyanothece sp. UBA12306]
MSDKIVVAMDMSEMGQEVFRNALSLSLNNNSQLMLLHVLSGEEENSPLPIPPDLKQLYPAQGNDLTL